MQIAEENQKSRNRVKNTFSTDSSKRQNEIENDENFKNERKKYLQERLNRRKQVKQVRKQKFGSSSSQSEASIEKQKPKSKIMEFTSLNPVNVEEQKLKKEDDQFHQKHQAYIKEKLARKQEMIEQRKKQFGSSSSDSDEEVVTRKFEEIKIQQPTIIVKSQKNQILSPEKIISANSPLKRSIGNESNDSQRGPIIVQQIVFTKGEKVPEAKKLTILVQSKKNFAWIEETLVIENKRIKFINQNTEFMIAYVTKIKLLFSSVSKEFLKVKITFKDDDYFFAVSSKRFIDGVPEYFYVFSRIIQEKLTQIGFEPKKNESSIFPNYMNLKDAPEILKRSAFVFGNIFKKSQILGNWETRFVSITDKEIVSSKRPNDKPSMVIAADSITELWTRFDIENSNMLNIKIMYAGKKTEFGIPVSNFTDEYNWLYCFYRIIKARV